MESGDFIFGNSIHIIFNTMYRLIVYLNRDMLNTLLYPEQFIQSSARYECFNFISMERNERYFCSHCKDILIKPKQTPCGCRFCHTCLKDLLKNEMVTCPGCSTVFFNQIDFNDDKAVEKELFQLEVECLNEHCQYRCILKDLAVHLKVCEFRMENCSSCSQFFPSNQRSEHENTLCMMIKKICKDCGEEMTRKKFEEEHQGIKGNATTLCGHWKGICPYACNDIVHENIKTHLKDCPNVPIECSLKEAGCSKIVPRFSLFKHFHLDIEDHMKYLLQMIWSIKEENLKLYSKFKENVSRKCTEIEGLRGHIKKMGAQIDGAVQKLRILEGNHRNVDAKVKPLRVVYGECEWLIDNISERIQEAKNGINTTLFSQPFYTAQRGYKLCLKMFPNGNGAAMGQSVSLYFVVMKGEYDDEISWPFRKSISFSITNKDRSLKRTMTMKPDSNSLCYGRPDGLMNLAAGHPDFVSHKELLTRNESIFVHARIL